MAYIYKIINLQNQKIYIGKTYCSIEKRWAEHIRDSAKEELKNRPLYAAMRKYGYSNFIIEEIEQTDTPEERERYWIEFYGSFHNGYNATLGGDGKPYIDYDLVIQVYNQTHNQKETAKIIGIDVKTVNKILKNKEIPIIHNVGHSKKIAQYDLDGNLLNSFLSGADAGKYIIELKLSTASINSVGNRIRECANNKRQTAYGFIWKFL